VQLNFLHPWVNLDFTFSLRVASLNIFIALSLTQSPNEDGALSVIELQTMTILHVEVHLGIFLCC